MKIINIICQLQLDMRDKQNDPPQQFKSFLGPLQKYLGKKGFQIIIKKDAIYVFEVGDNESVGPDLRRRKERPRFRKQINQMMGENNWTIEDIIEHYYNNKDQYSKEFLTQANKIKYELDLKKERENLEDLTKKLNDD